MVITIPQINQANTFLDNTGSAIVANFCVEEIGLILFFKKNTMS